MDIAVNFRSRELLILILGSLILYWVGTLLGPIDATGSLIRSITGTFLILIAPGLLLARILRASGRSIGEFLLFSVALSLALFSLWTTAAGILLPRFGIAEPLSFRPLSIGLLLLVLGLTIWLHAVRDEVTLPRARLEGPIPFLLLLISLPALAALAVVVREGYGSNAGMFLLILVIVLVVILSATRYVPPELFPFTLFFVALATLLHRNLMTNHVIGADVQLNYFVSSLVLRTHQWSPDLGGTMIALPVVSSVPSAFSILTGIGLATTYKVIFSGLFSIVPVGVYYVGRELFDRDIALFGAYFFVFYHVSFLMTPGKQLMSELFVVPLLLILLRGRLVDEGYKVVTALLSIGVIFSHYAMTFVFALSLLAAYVGLSIADRLVGGIDHDLTPWYPSLLLLSAIAWYAYSSNALIVMLSGTVTSFMEKIGLLLSGTLLVSAGSSGSFSQSRVMMLQYVVLALYVLFTGFISIAIVRKVVSTLWDSRRGMIPERVELIALAVPMYLFLASSYFAPIDLWAPRVYQLVLPVLAPFMAYGYSMLNNASSEILNRPIPRWEFLAIALSLLLVLNTGLAFSVVATSEEMTFNPNAHDLMFQDSELAGGLWIKSHTNVSRISPAPRHVSTEYPQSRSSRVRIYVDRYTYQMFRSILSQEHYDVQYVYLRSEWQPEFNVDQINHGYVFIRKRAVVDSGETDLPTPYLSGSKVRKVEERGDVVFSNDDVRIVRIHNRLAANDVENSSTQ